MRFKNWYIKFCRYILGKPFLPVMAGYLKGYLWTTRRSYNYIIGDYEDPDTIEQLAKWCKKDTVFYDVGANVGYHALVVNSFITEGKIYSFEPVPSNIALFKAHMALNNDKMKQNNIELLTFAIADTEKEVQFSNSAIHTDGNTYIASSEVYQQAEDVLTVQCFSIDNLLEKGYEPPTILKIDVEGAEYDVLIGAINTINRYRPNIVLATHDFHLPGVKDKCVAFLEEANYQLKHTGRYNKYKNGLDDFIAIHRDNVSS